MKLPHWDRADWIDPFNLLSERPNIERNINEDDTILILSREGQRNYFDKCSRSNSCVALDATHNTSRYDLKLLSVHGLSPSRKGVPIIYGFLSRETTELVQLVLASITDCTNTGGKNVSTIISDDDNSSFAAVSQEWPHVEHMFLCHFHLIKRLKQHLARSNISKTQKESVLHNFYKLMYQSLKSEEVDTICETMLQVVGKGSNLGKYIHKQFLCKERRNRWTFNAREEAQESTGVPWYLIPFSNSVCESFHSFLKKILLGGIQNREISILVEKLLSWAEETVRNEILNPPTALSREQALELVESRRKKTQEEFARIVEADTDTADNSDNSDSGEVSLLSPPTEEGDVQGSC